MRSGIPHVDHCVLDASSMPNVMRCNHCKGTEVVHFPVDLILFLGTCKRFMRAHRKCRPNAANTIFPNEQS